MPKNERLHRHTLHLFEGDYHRLQEYYSEVGAAAVVRKLVRLHLKELDARVKNEPAKIDVAV